MGIQIDNPLGTQKVSSLLHRFALPSIVAMLVSSLYNIVDQFFIGHSVGELGNEATNISFPVLRSHCYLGLAVHPPLIFLWDWDRR